MERIAVVGSREFPDMDFVRNKVIEIISKSFGHIRIVSGGARGVDRVAVFTVNKYKERYPHVETEVHDAEWNKYGKRAGALRNKVIVERCDRVIAFWDGKSAGTKMTVDMALKEGKPVDLYIRSE